MISRIKRFLRWKNRRRHSRLKWLFSSMWQANTVPSWMQPNKERK